MIWARMGSMVVEIPLEGSVNLNSIVGSFVRAELVVVNGDKVPLIPVVGWTSFYYLDSSLNVAGLIVQALRHKKIIGEILIYIFAGGRGATIMHWSECHLIGKCHVQNQEMTILQFDSMPMYMLITSLILGETEDDLTAAKNHLSGVAEARAFLIEKGYYREVNMKINVQASTSNEESMFKSAYTVCQSILCSSSQMIKGAYTSQSCCHFRC
ncbi:hypothetical protein MKW92_011687 [Papaver armeniacum]|nr:hypothetical protein MKW92_011687 [Papaver armeniacum]